MLWGSTIAFPGTADLALVVLLAFLFDLAIGDPPSLYQKFPHPVALLGKAVEELERRLNRKQRGRSSLLWRGGAVTLFLCCLATALGWVISWASAALPGGFVVEALIASSLIAYRSLHDHVSAVVKGLRKSLEAGREAVAKIVGRDPAQLDGPGVARASVESLAENFSDGVIAPLFWFLLLGLPGLFVYKTINTLDSMVGYRNDRFEAFGKIAARLDDAVNWIPARLAGFIIVISAVFLPAADPSRALRILLRDAPKHRSPNAGWQEAAFAGALDFALAGPRRYKDGRVEDAWMGEGRKDLSADDLEHAITLYRLSGLLTLMILIAVFGLSR